MPAEPKLPSTPVNEPGSGGVEPSESQAPLRELRSSAPLRDLTAATLGEGVALCMVGESGPGFVFSPLAALVVASVAFVVLMPSWVGVVAFMLLTVLTDHLIRQRTWRLELRPTGLTLREPSGAWLHIPWAALKSHPCAYRKVRTSMLRVYLRDLALEEGMVSVGDPSVALLPRAESSALLRHTPMQRAYQVAGLPTQLLSWPPATVFRLSRRALDLSPAAVSSDEAISLYDVALCIARLRADFAGTRMNAPVASGSEPAADAGTERDGHLFRSGFDPAVFDLEEGVVSVDLIDANFQVPSLCPVTGEADVARVWPLKDDRGRTLLRLAVSRTGYWKLWIDRFFGGSGGAAMMLLVMAIGLALLISEGPDLLRSSVASGLPVVLVNTLTVVLTILSRYDLLAVAMGIALVKGVQEVWPLSIQVLDSDASRGPVLLWCRSPEFLEAFRDVNRLDGGGNPVEAFPSSESGGPEATP